MRHIHIIPLSLFILAVSLLSCSKDDYGKGVSIDKYVVDPSSSTVDRKAGRDVVAYCTYYGMTTPDTRILTQINYAFAELYVKDGKYEGFKLQGDESRFRTIVNLKKAARDLKILLSFSHTVINADNEQGGGFSTMSSTEAGRKAFAQDCLAFCQKWGIDGIDLDWELPGVSWSGHACDPVHDTDNFTLLIKQLRETLGNKYLLTFAGYVKDKQTKDDGTSRNMDLNTVKDYVDKIYVMTYDLDEAPHHHSAIEDSDAYWDWKRTLDVYDAAEVPREKIVFGVPFYARHSFSGSSTSIDYKNIIALDFKVYKIDNWDDDASVPYITERVSNTFYAGYDNAKSIAIKASWAMSKGMAGLMCWDYDADDAQGTLRMALWNGVMGY